MARVFTDGAETGDTTFWSVVAGANVSTSSPPSGSYYYTVTGSSSTLKKTLSPALNEFYFRVRYNNTVFGSTHMFQFLNSSTVHMSLTFDTNTYQLKAYLTGSTLVATSGKSYLPNTWYLIEVYMLVHDTTGRFVVKVDGETVINYTGDTRNGATTTVDVINVSGSSSYIARVDDVALNDTTGSTDNGWCGDGKVVALLPNAAGDSTQWTPSTGSNYQCVDELPPSDTDYVSASGTGFIDNYNLTSYTLSGTESVGRVWVYARAKDTLAAGTLNLGLRTNSTNYTVGKVLGTSFGLIATSGWALNPNTGVTWTQSDLDALQSTIGMP